MHTLYQQIAALLFASTKPLSLAEMEETLNQFNEAKTTVATIEKNLNQLIEDSATHPLPFSVVHTGGGYQWLTNKLFHPLLIHLNKEKTTKLLSNAALETLAIIAYKQPITKTAIENIRGVNCDYSVQKLLEKELIHISGRVDTLPGNPLLYSTSEYFMDYLGINHLSELPTLTDMENLQTTSPALPLQS